MKLIPQLYDIKDFTWTNPEQSGLGCWVGVADASDLGCRCGTLPHHQIYDDACDEGFEVVNHKTGKSCTFYLVREMRPDGEGELQGWSYVSNDGNQTIIRILND
jgi:hypothetical protein